MNIDNVITIYGRLVMDPELKATGEGVEYAVFRVAVNRSYAKQGEERKSDFFNCKAWRQTAVFIDKYFKKGQLVRVIGELQNNQYMKDDQKRDYYEIIVDSVGFCGSKSENAAATKAASESNTVEEVDEEALPF